MHRNLLTEFNLTVREFKNLQKIVITKNDEPDYTLQENNEKVKNCNLISLHDKSETSSMVSELAEINFSLPVTIKNIDTVSKRFILTNPLTSVEESIENDRKILNINSKRFQLPKNLSKSNIPPLRGKSVAHLVTSTGNSSSANNAAKIKSLSVKISSNADRFNDTNDFSKTVPPGTVVTVEPEGKRLAQLKLDTDLNRCSGDDSLPLISSAEPSEFRSGDSSNLEECEVVNERINNDHDFSPENEPFCVISEIIGNADVVFSNIFDFDENYKKSPDVENKNNDSIESDGSNSRVIEDGSEFCEIIDEKIKPAFSDLKDYEKNPIEGSENEAKIKESKGAEVNNFENNSANVRETPEVTSKENPVEKCSAAFSASDSVKETAAEILETETITPKKIQPESTFTGPEIQLITPKKTNDITKIKGWRRKQFLVEKPTTVEFYRLEKAPRHKKRKIKTNSESVVPEIEEAENIKNAFVCDSLDEFLDREAELKVGYEIPHLYAEVGIKLTKEDVASKPNLSDRDFKEMETRYCIPVQGKMNIVNLDEIDEEIHKAGKRFIEDDPKPIKFSKLQDGRRQQSLLKHEVRIKSVKKENLIVEGTQEHLKQSGTISKYAGTKSVSNVRLKSKLLGLVVYPGPFQPLHPIVQHHIEKLRSYYTRIDKNWACFAASAVFSNDKHYKKRILPVRCCVKIEKCAKPVIKNESLLKKKLPAETEEPKSIKCSKENIKLKGCRVVIDKIDVTETLSPWCMEHHTYNCEPCGLLKSKPQGFKSLLPCMEETGKEGNTGNEGGKAVVSPKAGFDREIVNLLARKLRNLKFKGNTLTSIESLKKLVPDRVEFIKLNFVKESFLSSYISIWFLKQENPGTRCRAFITFSQTPPMPNAVNLKSDTFSLKNLPKVITDIMSSDNVFSPDEYAILHCNGEIWEIHGSLNIAFGKPDKNMEQIFASVHLPELKQLQKVAEKILNVKAVKWWVVDLTQKFKLIEIKFGNVISVVWRNKFLETIRNDSHGFIPIRKNSEGRILGAFIFRPLLPFVLMGPYYLLETHDMTLKGARSNLPFMYFVKENVMKDCPLKYFINSVLKHVQENDKILEGLWLYDKMFLDNTAYLEVLTRTLSSPLTSKFGNIDIEHGYSLSSLTNSLPSGVADGLMKRKDGQEELKRVTVYLYFDLFELGYVEGELQRDNSVIICHPLDRRTKVKSHKVGDWFIRTIKRRIEFIPKDLELKWFITKHKEDLRERRPFHKFVLGGAHVLTKSGIFYLLEMSESSIAKLGIEKNEIVKAIKESQVIRTVLEMRKLANLLSSNYDGGLTMEKVLTKANHEIETLKLFGECLEKEKSKAKEERLSLLCRFFHALESCQLNEEFKFKMLENIERIFVKEDGNLSKEFVGKLKEFDISRKYFFLTRNRKCYGFIKKISDKHSETPNNAHKKCKWSQFCLSNSVKPSDSSVGEKLPFRESDSPRITETSEDFPELSFSLPQQKSFNPTSVGISDVKNTSPEKTKPKQDSQGLNAEGKRVNEIMSEDVKNSIVKKSDGFLKPTSASLPENIKFYWKNSKS